MYSPLLKIVSGGQTGVDRAALDLAMELGLPCGGWCPLGRKAEDGPIDSRYSLTETPSSDYIQRTEWNVRDSHATLVLCRGEPSGGTAITIDFARQLGKPCLAIDLEKAIDPSVVQDWLTTCPIRVLNVAGPRESLNPGIYRQAMDFLRQIPGLTGVSAG